VGKVSVDDKMRIQTLCKQGLGYCAIAMKYPELGANTLNTFSNKLFLQGFELLASCDSLKCQISTFSFDFNTSTMIGIFIVIVLHGTVAA